MDHAEARHVLAGEIARCRATPRTDLLDLLRAPRHREVAGRRGRMYQVEVQAFWDNRASGDLHVVASVDDGGLRAFCPITDGFIVSADGRFIGE